MAGILARVYTMFCPRCDRKFKSTMSPGDALELTKKHVAGQHPDHDPLWHETYPHPED